MNDSADLLKALKIDRNAPAPREPRRALLYGAAVAAVVLVAVKVQWMPQTYLSLPLRAVS